MLDLFSFLDEGRRFEVLRPGAAIPRGYAPDQERAIVDALHSILEASPFRRMVTPGGHTIGDHDQLRCGRRTGVIQAA